MLRGFALFVVLALGLGAWATTPSVAVLPFIDEAGTGLIGVGMGLGRMLAQELSAAGYRVISPDGLKAFLDQNGIQPSPAAWRGAALSLGAEYLVQGRVEDFHASSISIALVFVTMRGASVEVELGATVEDLRGGTSREVRARAEASGPVSLELNLYFPTDVCWGGFRTDKAVYYPGEAVLLGYRDPSPPNSFYVVIHPAGSPSPSWTSPIRSSSPSDPCVTWTWDQTFGSNQAAPGEYTAELYNALLPTPIANRAFTISATAAAELVVGSGAFQEAPWGKAVADAMAELVKGILDLLPEG